MPSLVSTPEPVRHDAIVSTLKRADTCNSSSLCDVDRLSKHQSACKFFDYQLSDESGKCHGQDIAKFLRENGFLKDDPRFQKLYGSLLTEDQVFREDIVLDDFIALLTESGQSTILEKAFRLNLVAPEFSKFCHQVEEIFFSVRQEISTNQGACADYIPQLAKVDPALFGLSICTVDGQRFLLGDATRPFCIQSCVKPLLYGLALEEHGQAKVRQHIGCEPSGVKFNDLSLNREQLPHNPMINAGAIMACSLLQSNKRIYERFEYVVQNLTQLSGGFSWGFSNSVYLSERETADSNFCLAYMMRGQKAFPENTDISEVLEFYFQCCSLETSCNAVAVLGATIANGGVCPLTGERIFKRQTCRDILSMMYSCGMYDYSGEWAFYIGIPAKSGVSGCIYAIIPDFGCISIFSPPLDSIGNSVRGVEFFKRLIQKYVFHHFDTTHGLFADDGTHAEQRQNPRRTAMDSEREGKINALYAAAAGDLTELRRLLISGVSENTADYDGRALLHLAASEGHLAIVKYLLRYPALNLLPRDRWGNTPYQDAVRHGHTAIAAILERSIDH